MAIKNSRTTKAGINSMVSIVALIVKTVATFLVRTVFIFSFGKQVLGFNAVMTNVLTILSLAELGVGTSMAFYLYKPMAENNKELVKSYLINFRKLYRLIAVIVTVIGILVIPIVDKLVNANSLNFNVDIAYLLFLGNTVASYLLNYKRSILIADQKSYITLVLDQSAFLVISIIQIVTMMIFKNFYFYLALQIVGTFFGNVMISKYANHYYREIVKYKYIELDKSRKLEFYKNLVGNFTSKLGGMVVFGTDNLLINYYAGLKVVGLYSNYVLITNAVQNIIRQSTSAITASIGNLIVESDTKRIYRTFKNTLFFSCGITYMSGFMILISINSFINLWIGKDFIVPNQTLILIVVNYILTVNRNIIITFCEAYGLFWEQRWNPIIEAILNLTISIILGRKMGMNGILIGTTVSTIFTVFWFEPYLLFKKGIDMKQRKYWKLWGKYNVGFLIINLISFLILLNFKTTNIFTIVVKGIMFSIISIILIWIFFSRDDSYKYWQQMLINVRRKYIQHKNI